MRTDNNINPQPATGADASNATAGQALEVVAYRARYTGDGWPDDWALSNNIEHAPTREGWAVELLVRQSDAAARIAALEAERDASHAELLQIHAAIMCIAEAPEPTNEHTYTVRAVLDMARRIRNYESQRREMQAEVERLRTLLNAAREALMPHMALCRGTSVPNHAAQVVGRIERELDA